MTTATVAAPAFRVTLRKQANDVAHPNGRPGKYFIPAYLMTLDVTSDQVPGYTNKVPEFTVHTPDQPGRWVNGRWVPGERGGWARCTGGTPGAKLIGHLVWGEGPSGIVVFGHSRENPADRPGHGGLWSGNGRLFRELTGIAVTEVDLNLVDKRYRHVGHVRTELAATLVPDGYVLIDTEYGGQVVRREDVA